ncbi:MAG TPA: serine/threonine protein kinase [Candidatus Limnocylindrales bacterium]|nr:serine/threonine protein kinase [Candidatus Limnocylindrales bacterium]
MRLWCSERESDIKSYASDVRVQGVVLELVELAHNPNTAALANSATAQAMKLYLSPLLETHHYVDYLVISPQRRVLAALDPKLVNLQTPPVYETNLRRALGGKPAISRPFLNQWPEGQYTNSAIMFVAAPVTSNEGKVVAILALRMNPEDEFSRIFSMSRLGKTGESYAFDRRAVMLTASRFDPELRKLGLIPSHSNSTSVLNLRLTDPGVDLERGKSSLTTHSEFPLTRMAAEAIKGWEGVDVQGYRNYRGLKVVGAWSWVPEYGMGVATEEAAEEAFETFYILRRAFVVLFLLLVLSACAILVFTLSVERLQASVRRNALAARHLGQYVLMQEIGRGANGMVYRARHSLLRRPVAIKLLSPEMTNDGNIARFEHEVQMTSQLTHPNTIAIYDFGRTPEGLFYYAMEYLSGINLDQLVRRFGPQPEGRVIHVLRQVCASLAEAHQIGLIHRDIKPANIVLTRRGGAYDMVKVLDFGVVRAVHIDSADKASLNAIVGTPHFMSPEAIERPASVDARSDLYSVGALGYWLLTGKTLFDGQEVQELLKQQVQLVPPRVSERLGTLVTPDLEAVIASCLSKVTDQRPASAEVLEAALGACSSAKAWTAEDAENWWKEHLAGVDVLPVTQMAEKTLIIADRS